MSFDEDVRQCFVLCSAIDVSDTAWKQAQLSWGLRSSFPLWPCCCCLYCLAFLIRSAPIQQSPSSAVIAYNSKAPPHITQSWQSLPSLFPPLRESCPARLMRINSNLCWEHPAQPTKPDSCLFQPLIHLHGCQWPLPWA